MKQINIKKLKAYSLLEIVATLAIVAIIMVMLTNILFLTLDVSKKAFARSQVREEQNAILTNIEKDIRNARYIENCSGSGASADCEIYIQRIYHWGVCQRANTNDLYVCKKDESGNIIEGMSENIKLDQFTIETGIAESSGKKTILITLVVSHTNPEFDVSNQVRQLAISTRNFGI